MKVRFTLIEFFIVLVLCLSLSAMGAMGYAVYWGLSIADDAVHGAQTTHQTTGSD